MGYRFLDDYDPQKEQKKKKQQNGAQKAPRSSNSLKPLAAAGNTTAPSAQAQAQAAAQPRTTQGTALGGSSVTPVQLPKPLEVPKLTKAAAPIQKTTPAQPLKLPEIKAFGAGNYGGGKAAERTAKTAAAGVLSSAAGAVELAGQFRPTTGQQSLGQFSGFGDLGRAVRENREKGTDIAASIRVQEQQRRVRQKLGQQKIFDAADRLAEKGRQYEQEAKEGLGTVGQFLVDMGVTGTQMAGDALANLVLPGSGLVMMGMRSYGQAAGEARRQGKSEKQQFLAGLKSAAIEVFTEKMFGAFSQVYGGAAADELVEKLVGKLAKNTTGQALLTWMVNAAGEGVEEVTSDLLNPLADRLLRLDDGKGAIYSMDDLAQWGYDFLLGTAMGMLGGGTQLAQGVRQGRAQTAESRYYDDLRRNGLGSATAAENAQRASDAMGRLLPKTDGLRMPQLTTYELKRMDTSSPTGGRHAPNIVFRDDVSISDPSVPQAQESVNRLKMPQLADEQGRTYEQRQAAQTSRHRNASRYSLEEAAARQKDARTFRNIIAGIDTSISDFFERWKSGRKSHLGETLEQLYIAPMPNSIAEDISKIVGYDVDSRDFIITSDDVKHVMDQHGNPTVEIAKGNIPLEAWMLDALPDVVTSPDSIEAGNLGTGNKNAGKRGIVFSKAFPSGKIITIQFDNRGRGTLELNTMYAKESATLEGNGTNVPNTFTPEAAKPALSYAEKTRMSRYTMPDAVENVAPVINAQNGPPQSFFSKIRVPQNGGTVNSAEPAAPLRMPQLTALDGEGNLIYKKPEGPDVASDSPTAEPQNTIADTEPSIDTTIPQGREGVNTQGMQRGGQYASGPAAPLQMPRLTDEQGRTYEERISANTEIGEADVHEQVRRMDAANEAAAVEAVQQRIVQEHENRKMPEALKKLGVAPFGSEADYAGVDALVQSIHGNHSARKQMQKQMSKIPATEKERAFARKLADGTLDAADIPDTVSRETVELLADFYRTMDTAPESMLLRQRRAAIMEREEAKMEPLLGMDVAYDEGGLRTDTAGRRKPSSKVSKQFSTLRRNLQTPARICATEWGPEHGKKVYETLFYPVTENNGRQIEWVNSMLDRVRIFKDSEGAERPLNRKERELVQKIVEYRASEKRVKAFDEQYKSAVDNVRNGASAADAAKELGIDPSYPEYQDLQNYQTYLKALEELNDSKSADSAAVNNAVEVYSGLYKELYEGINSFLVAHGYQTIGFIEGYAPHMQPEAEKTAFSKALKLLGLDDTAMSLPTSISGKTADLKPYKQYNPFFQERHGVNTEYDIAKGFEDYVYYLGNIFYHTDDIMRIRTAEKYIRKTYSSEEASEQISWAENARNFSDDQIADFLRMNGVIQKGTELAAGDARVFLEDYISKLYDQIGNVTRYSEMAKYLDNYANRLAGKQNMADRGAEAATGRGSLNWINTLTGKYGGAKLAFNVSSALNQTSQIPMVAAENGERVTLHAIGDFFKNKRDRADFVQESNFLKGKKGINWLLGPETKLEKVKEAGFAMTEAVDSFTSYVAVRSKYLKEVNAGKNHAEAMKLADEYGRSVMGSRARGEKPVLFDTKNPFWQIVTRFQLEAMNSWEHVSRDVPNEIRQMAREQGKAHAAGVMGVRVAKYLAYAFLLNLGIGALSGGSPVPYDVIGSTLEALGKSMGVSKLAMVDDVLEKLIDTRVFGTDGGDDDDTERDWWAFLKSLGGDVMNDIPLVGQGAALLGIGDQTLATTDLSKVGDFAKSVKNNGLFSGDTLDKGLTAAGEFMFGGNQLRKTIQGGKAVVQGGVYSKGKLRYQVEQTPGNYAKGLLFGRSALGESQEYYADRTSDFSEYETSAFEQMQDVGVSAKTGYDLLRELKEIGKTEESTRAERQRDALRQSGVSGAGKWVTYYQTMASETEWKAMDAVQYNSEADYGTVTNLLMDLKEQDKDADKMRLIDKSDLSDSQKASLYKSLVAKDEDIEKIDALKETGITDYQYLQYKIATSGLTKKEAKLNAINTLDLTNSQKDALYYLNSYASSTHGEAPWVRGMTAEESAYRLIDIAAENANDGDDISDWRKSLYKYLGYVEFPVFGGTNAHDETVAFPRFKGAGYAESGVAFPRFKGLDAENGDVPFPMFKM